MKKITSTQLFTLALFLGILAGYVQNPLLFQLAEGVSTLFVNVLKLVSLPIIFLSIVSTACGMENVKEAKTLGKNVVKYTLLTTVLAATIALFVFLIVDPVRGVILQPTEVAVVSSDQKGYISYLMQTVPSNIVEPFLKNNVLGVLFLALAMGLATLFLPDENKKTLHQIFSAFYAVFLKMTAWIIQLTPFAVWAFVSLFIKDLQQGLHVEGVFLLLVCVVASNLLQGILVLPFLLWLKGIPVIQTFRGMFPALSIAFFSKSSNAALPMAISCAEENLKISKKVARFTFPLCTTINMNGCAAFILTTVLFTSMSYGTVYSPLELMAWILIATLAAVGNAGVPMGCFFLASAFVAAMDLPLHFMGVILPFYALIDMLETAINVWSDSCVAAVVQREFQPQQEYLQNQPQETEVLGTI